MSGTGRVECECPVEGHDPGCPNAWVLGRFVQLGRAYERLGRLMQAPDTGLDELVEAAWACGLQLEFRLSYVEKNEQEPEPEPHQHVWTYSLGDTHERCVECGERRSVATGLEDECPAGM